jgi:molybdopterin molybdotransferase
VLVTGSELLPLGAAPEPGRIHESNGLALRRLGERAGAVITGEDRVPDDADATRSAVARALDAADVVVVTGGVSVGPHDHVRPALTACGVEEVFWRVRLRPGKPLWFGTRGETLVFGLPGNPLSAIVCFLCFLEPALRRLQGEPDAALRTVPARLAVPAEAGDGRTTFLTSALRRGADGVLEATPDEHQGSHLTGALAKADGFVVAPHDAGVLPAGALVQAVPLA